MRISLLRQRERFGPILEATLARYWSEQQGTPFQVEFHPGRPVPGVSKHRLWCNTRLNAIFHPSIAPEALDPIRKEFSSSPLRWRRPPQRWYVELATGPWLARWCADASLAVHPSPPSLGTTLIVPGNQRVRLLDHAAGTSISLLKEGFSSEAFERELEGRRWAAEAGVAVPQLISSSNHQIVEVYISATPLNRLIAAADRRRVSEAALVALRNLVASTQQSQPLSDYTAALLDESLRLINRDDRYDRPMLLALEQSARDLHQCIKATVEPAMRRQSKARVGSESLTTAITHGDFQPANILMDEEGATWIIDWENTGRRQAAYDFLVWRTASRLAPGLADRLLSNDLQQSLAGQSWTNVDWGDPIVRHVHFHLFMWEELNWHLRENANQHFVCHSPGLQRMQSEIRRWLANVN